MFYVLGDGCLDAVVKKGDVDLRWEIVKKNKAKIAKTDRIKV